MYDGGRTSCVSSASGVAEAASDNLLTGRSPPRHMSFVARGSLHEMATTGFCPHVDVRMIDFAHATHQGFLQDKTAHVGPDHGYLFGLKNLIQLFETELSSSDISKDSAKATDDCCATVL